MLTPPKNGVELGLRIIVFWTTYLLDKVCEASALVLRHSLFTSAWLCCNIPTWLIARRGGPFGNYLLKAC